MAELQNPDPLVEAVAKARAEASRRPDLKFPTGNLNIVGDICYAYSGLINATNATLTTAPTMLEFTTGPETLKFNIMYFDVSSATYDRYMGIYFNSKQIISYQADGTPDQQSPWEIVVPPYTLFKIRTNINGVTTVMSVAITGTVHQ